MEGKSWKEYNQLHDPPHAFDEMTFWFNILFACKPEEAIIDLNQLGFTLIMDYRSYYYICYLMLILCCILPALYCRVFLSRFKWFIEMREKEEPKQYQLSRLQVLIYVVLSRIVSFSPFLHLTYMTVGSLLFIFT